MAAAGKATTSEAQKARAPTIALVYLILERRTEDGLGLRLSEKLESYIMEMGEKSSN